MTLEEPNKAQMRDIYDSCNNKNLDPMPCSSSAKCSLAILSTRIRLRRPDRPG
jgi:hypothetical protein